MKKKRKKQQTDNRSVLTLVTAIISLMNSIIALIVTLSR